MSEKNVFKVRLMRWGDSSASGRTVTFKLPDDTDEHPFKGLPVGAKAGQMMEMEIAILDDDSEPETLGRKKSTPKFKPAAPVAEPSSGHVHAAGSSGMRNKPESAGSTSDTTNKAGSTSGAGGYTGSTSGTGSADVASETRSGSGSGTAGGWTPPFTGAVGGDTQEGETGDQPTGAVVYGSGNVDLSSYADHMNQTAETLAIVAEHLGHQVDDGPRYPSPTDDDDGSATPGEKAVNRAVALCKAVDKQRAGFFYYMRSLHPDVPSLPGEGGTWSRDAKATRDRVCFHCETKALQTFADDDQARRKFEQLENEFERSERMR